VLPPGFRGRVGDWLPCREVWPSHRALIISLTGVTGLPGAGSMRQKSAALARSAVADLIF
jgi:hypothetical protein